MTFSSIELTHSSGLATITLNRPEVHNAFNAEVINELLTALAEIANGDARVFLLKANGKHFSAGADLKWMRETAKLSRHENIEDASQLAKLMQTLNSISIPTIACVQGAAFGGALGLISCADIALASTDAFFCLSEVKIGLIPAVISPYVINAIGQREARRYFLTAEKFNANDAQKLGLIHEVFEPNQLNDATNKLIDTLLKNSPNALKLAKELIFNVSNATTEQSVIEYTQELIAEVRVSPEGQEGLNAFFEKREPNWITT